MSNNTNTLLSPYQYDWTTGSATLTQIGSTNITTTTTAGCNTITTTTPNWNYDGINWGNQTTLPYVQPYSNHFTFNFVCYPSSEGRISTGKRELIFKILQTTRLDYEKLIKHLNIDVKLYNTLLMEYALQFKMKLFMELFSRTNCITPESLYKEVIMVYK